MFQAAATDGDVTSFKGEKSADILVIHAREEARQRRIKTTMIASGKKR